MYKYIVKKAFMKKRNIGLLTVLALLLWSGSLLAQDSLAAILAGELAREMAELAKQEVPPYYLSYRVDDVYAANVQASFGDLIESKDDRFRMLTVQVRVGSPALDNTHELRGGWDYLDAGWGSFNAAEMPLEDTTAAIRQALWKATDTEYRESVDMLARVKANVAVKVAEEDRSPDFSAAPAAVYFEPPLKPEDRTFDRAAWEEKVKKYSKPFLDDPDIFDSEASIRFTVTRKYFVSSEGARVVHNQAAARLAIYARIKAADGMVLPLFKDYFAFRPADLPDDSTVLRDVREIVRKLTVLKTAPIVDPYAGPALLTAGSAGVFFHEIFGHRVEGERQKSESDAQTFKKKVGQKVLPTDLSVIFDPGLKQYRGQDMYGSYLYDDQGVNGQRLAVVDHGVLKGFLMSRCPIENFPASNGHGRAQPGLQPVARQSNLIVETSRPLPVAAMRQQFLAELKRQGKQHGYLFADVTGGFTMTGRFIPNAFNVTPTEVYRVYVDGRPDELVRGVDLVGTPLSVFSQIVAAGDRAEIFTGTCGAESGGVPVSAASPALFVKQIEIQRKSKSQELPPILPRPGLGRSAGNE